MGRVVGPLTKYRRCLIRSLPAEYETRSLMSNQNDEQNTKPFAGHLDAVVIRFHLIPGDANIIDAEHAGVLLHRQ